MRDFLKCLINGIKLGAIVAAILVVFNIATTDRVEWVNIGVTVMFSIVIATVISFLIKLIDNYRKKYNPKNFYFIWAAYYLASLVGMTIASELCFFIVRHFIYHTSYILFAEPRQLWINLIISLIATTIVGAYQSQRTSLEMRIKEKELDIVKLSQLKTQAELQSLQSRINPHFLYNSLNSIASLIHIDADRAEDMTLKLSKLFRYSINTQNENLTSVKEEVEIVNTYLDIEKVRFGSRINFNLDIAEDALNEKIPRFILQPLIENAIKHGLNDKIEGGEITLIILKQEKEIVLIISDNGKPFPTELNSGYGLQSTYEKLQLLYDDKYAIQIINEPEKLIKITIPSSYE
jgi:two-component system LytT family sensor kinase